MKALRVWGTSRLTNKLKTVVEGSHERKRLRSLLNSNRVIITIPVGRQARLERRREGESQEQASETAEEREVRLNIDEDSLSKKSASQHRRGVRESQMRVTFST